MTDLDDAMHARLTAAGERWRAAAPAARTTPRPRRVTLVASAAVLVAVLVAGATLLATDGSDRESTGPGPSAATSSRPPGGPLGPGEVALVMGNRWRLSELQGGSGVYRDGLPAVALTGVELGVSKPKATPPIIEQIVVTRHDCGGRLIIGVAWRHDEFGFTGERTDSSAERSCLGTSSEARIDDLLPDLLAEIFAGSSVTYTVDQHTLKITRPGVGTAIFDDGSIPSHDTALLNTIWTLGGAIDEKGTQYGAPGRGFRLGVTDGRLVAGDGANSVSASVEVGPDALRLGDVGSRLVGSAAHPGEQAAVDAVTSPGDIAYRIVGDTLFLERGGVLLIYRSSN